MSQTTIYLIQGAFDITVLIIMILAAISDGKTRTIKPSYQWFLFGVGFMHFMFEVIAYPNDLWGHALNCALTGAFMFVLHIVMILISDSGIGGGDTKVSSLMAFYLGLYQSLCVVVIHTIAGISYVAYERFAKKRIIKSIPLMVFMAIGYSITKVIYWIIIL